jgi:hypothetical protein
MQGGVGRSCQQTFLDQPPFFCCFRASRESAALAKALSARGHEYERGLDVRAAVQVSLFRPCLALSISLPDSSKHCAVEPAPVPAQQRSCLLCCSAS